MTSITYVQIPFKEVPAGLRFDVPRLNQGQIVEVSYGDPAQGGAPAGLGDKYKRVHDASDNSTTFYKRS